MNIAVTDGIVLMPTPFGNGLDVWSSEDGTPGSATYNGAANASLIAADADFGICLELTKTQSVQKLRYMVETPIPTGTYLEVRVRVKALSGAFPSVRIAGWAGAAGGSHVSGVAEAASSVAIDTYGKIYEVSAIIGGGARIGVDMPWGRSAIYGHFGLDLTGATGGVVRIEDISIRDVTSVFLRDMIDVVDVMDYGAIPDGITDCVAAFEAADADANGRDILVPEGLYFLGSTITMANPVRFQGTLSMPDSAQLLLTRSFDFPTYADAFGDEELALKKALQALFNFTDHDTLDLKGRRIEISAPIDVQAAVGNKTSFATHRLVTNGQFNATDSTAWSDTVVTKSATYTASNERVLSNIANVGQIEVGSLVSGTGVGREIYVTTVNESAGEVGLSDALFGPAATQNYTFTKFKFIFDLSGFSSLGRFELDGVDFFCNGYASALLLAQGGIAMQLRECGFTRPKDRGIVSFGGACQGMQIDRCTFLSDEQAIDVEERKSIAVSLPSNDIKIRDNRVVRFRHFAMLSGTGYIIANNHFFQGDSSSAGTRSAGIIFTRTNLKTTIVGNYVDNAFIEFSNEHDADPVWTNTYSFGGIAITGNFFSASDVPNWFSWLQVSPYGAGHYLNGFTITDNVFKISSGNAIDRIDRVDTTYADLDHSKAYNITVTGNTFFKVSQEIANPMPVSVSQTSANATWSKDIADLIPFGGQIHHVESWASWGEIESGSGATRDTAPYFQASGSQDTTLQVKWPSSSRGTIFCKVRCDAID